MRLFSRVQVRLALVLVALVLMLGSGIGVLQLAERRRINRFFADQEEQANRVLDRIVRLNGASLDIFVQDYTYWDEMVDHVVTCDRQWAQENISQVMPTYEADAVWVFGPDGRPITAFGADEESPPFLSPELFKDRLDRDKLAHFFLDLSDGVMEIRGASIHPTADPERLTSPRGYFLAGRRWGEELLASLGELTGTQVSLRVHSDEGRASDPMSGTIAMARMLMGPDGLPVAGLEAVTEVTKVGEFNRANRRMFLLLMTAGLVGVVILALALLALVTRPLGLLRRSLEAGSPAPIRDLCRSATEFGELARNVVGSFADRARLRQEVNERERAEARFRELIENQGEGICMADAEERFTFVNPAAERIFGVEPGTLAGRNLLEFLDEEMLALVAAQTTRRKQGIRDSYELRIVRPDRGQRWLRITAVPHHDRQGAFDGVLGVFRDVTDEKRASAALRESEQRYRAVVDNIGTGISVIGPDMRVLQLNRRMRAWYPGIAEGERPLCYQAFQDPPRDKPCPDCTTRKAFGDAKVHEGEIELPVGGQRRTHRVVSSPILDQQGRVAAVIELVEDITERKRAEEALRESEERYRELFETTRDLVQSVRPDGSIEFVNRTWRETFGYTEEEVAGLKLWDVIHPECRERCAELFQRVLAGEQLERVEAVFRARDGRRVVLEGNVSARFEGGRCVRTRGLFHDITERKQAEEELRHRLGLEQVLADTASRFVSKDVGSWDESVEEALAEIGEFAGVDRCYLFRFSADSMWMTNTHEWCAPGIESQKEKLRSVPVSEFEWLASRLRAGQMACVPRVREMPIEARLERSWFVEHGVRSLVLVPLRVGGRTLGFIGFDSCRVEKRWSDDDIILLRTIGEVLAGALARREAEEALAARGAELERSNRELEEFAYVASHDLQEPLRMVGSYAELLARRYRDRLDDEAHEFIGYAVDGVRRMQGLINDLLTYSRVGSRGREPEPTDSNVVLDRALKNLELAIEDAGAEVEHEGLPEVMADPRQLEQLLQNLVGNAVKYRGSEPPRIRVAAARRNGCWEFSVRDNGIGIDPSYAERVFVVFQRLHGREEYEGNGIGLSVCKRIVERHGGRIWFESEPGQGTTFRFTLPAGKTPTAESAGGGQDGAVAPTGGNN